MIASIGIAATNTNAAWTSIVKAIIIAPNTIKGERKNNLKTRLTPFCTWLTSLVIRVIKVDVPTVSNSENDKLWIWLNKWCLKPVAQPTAALAAKYCAVIEQTSPIIASNINIIHILKI